MTRGPVRGDRRHRPPGRLAARSRRTRSPRSAGPSRSAPTASSSTPGGRPTAWSSCTTTPRLPDGRVIVDTPWRELPEHVPTLGDALDACAGAWVNIEIKNRPTEPDFDPDDHVAVEVLAHLAERGAGRWLISSFRLETIDRCRLVAPDVPTAWLTASIEPGDDRDAGRSAATSPCTRGSRRSRAADRRLPRRRPARQRLDVQRPGPLRRARRLGHRRPLHRRPRRHARRPPECVSDGAAGATYSDGSSTRWSGPRDDEADGVGDVVELEAVDLAEVVAVELVGERGVVLDDDVVEVDLLVEVVGRPRRRRRAARRRASAGSPSPSSCGT